MKPRTLRWLALAILVLILSALGFYIVPAHWTTIWADPEFTDWVSPISNRLVGQSRLYAHGLHLPIPPLSFILLRVLFPTGAQWFHENLLNYCFQSGMILLLFHSFSKQLRLSIAFGAAVASLPV